MNHKTTKTILLFVLLLLLSACVSGGSGAEEEGFDFPEEEIMDEDNSENAPIADPADPVNPDPAEGFDFTNEDNPNSEEGFDFTEEEVEEDLPEDNTEEEERSEIASEEWQALPPAGESTWTITNEVGSLDCGELEMEIGPEVVSLVQITTGPVPDLDLMTMQSLEEQGEINLYRDLSKPDSAIYGTDGYIPAGENAAFYYEITFVNLNGGEYADRLDGVAIGTIMQPVQGTMVECDMFRSFYGNLNE